MPRALCSACDVQTKRKGSAISRFTDHTVARCACGVRLRACGTAVLAFEITHFAAACMWNVVRDRSEIEDILE